MSTLLVPIRARSCCSTVSTKKVPFHLLEFLTEYCEIVGKDRLVAHFEGGDWVVGFIIGLADGPRLKP